MSAGFALKSNLMDIILWFKFKVNMFATLINERINVDLDTSATRKQSLGG